MLVKRKSDWWTILFRPDELSDMQPWSTILQAQQTNSMLQSLHPCRYTSLLPTSCLHDEKLRRSLRCPISVRTERGTKNPLAGEILSRLDIGERQMRHWMPSRPEHGRAPDSTFDIERPFNAVHLNLDCDWLLFAVNRTLYKEWRHLSADGEARRRVSSACRHGADRSITTFALGAIDLVARHALVNFARESTALPVVVATAIGKPGHYETE